MGGCPNSKPGSTMSSVRSVPGACRLARSWQASLRPRFDRLAEQTPGAVTPGCPGGLRLAKRRGLELKARTWAKQRRGNTGPRRFASNGDRPS
jgi:hypothetical protein